MDRHLRMGEQVTVRPEGYTYLGVVVGVQMIGVDEETKRPLFEYGIRCSCCRVVEQWHQRYVRPMRGTPICELNHDYAFKVPDEPGVQWAKVVRILDGPHGAYTYDVRCDDGQTYQGLTEDAVCS